MKYCKNIENNQNISKNYLKPLKNGKILTKTDEEPKNFNGKNGKKWKSIENKLKLYKKIIENNGKIDIWQFKVKEKFKYFAKQKT